MSDESIAEAKAIAAAEDYAAIAEYVVNGQAIDWRYWAEQMPVWGAADAARLINGLDPDLFADLSQSPMPNNNTSKETSGAKHAERLATAQGITSQAPEEWLTWACEHGLKVHVGMRLALREIHLRSIEPRTPEREDAPGDLDVKVKATNKAEPDWKATAQALGLEYLRRHKAQNLFPTQKDVCSYLEEELRKQAVFGGQKRPLSANYISRNAIQGEWWRRNAA